MWNRKKHGESRAKTTLKRGFAYAFCLAGSELGLVWPGLAWLGFLPLVFTSFFFFLGQVYADAESRWKEREKEGERSAENGRQTRLEIFARSQ